MITETGPRSVAIRHRATRGVTFPTNISFSSEVSSSRRRALVLPSHVMEVRSLSEGSELLCTTRYNGVVYRRPEEPWLIALKDLFRNFQPALEFKSTCVDSREEYLTKLAKYLDKIGFKDRLGAEHFNSWVEDIRSLGTLVRQFIVPHTGVLRLTSGSTAEYFHTDQNAIVLASPIGHRVPGPQIVRNRETFRLPRGQVGVESRAKIFRLPEDTILFCRGDYYRRGGLTNGLAHRRPPADDPIFPYKYRPFIGLSGALNLTSERTLERIRG